MGELQLVRCRDRTTRILLPQCVILTALLAACAEPAQDSRGAVEDVSDGVLRVYAVNYPLAYFAGRIGGDAVDASFRRRPASIRPRGCRARTRSPSTSRRTLSC